MGVFNNTFGNTLVQLGAQLNQNPSTVDLVQMFDGTIVAGEMVDLSPLTLNAKIGTNPIRNADCEGDWGFINFAEPELQTISRSATQKHSGTYSWKCDSLASGGIKTSNFKTVTGHEYSVSFWVFIEQRIASGYPDSYLTKGDNSGYINNMPIDYNIIGSWQHITSTYTETAGGNFANILVYIPGGTECIFYVDDFSIIDNTVAQTFITLAENASLYNADTEKIFFDVTNHPYTLNLADIAGFTKKAFYNGSNILLYSSEQKGNNFLKAHDYIEWNPITSITNIVTVGAGKDYATIQAAIDSITDATVEKKYRIDIYDDFAATQTTDYQVDLTYFHYLILKDYVYLNGIGTNRTIACSLPAYDPVNSSKYGLSNFEFKTGLNNLTITSQYTRYTLHDDWSALLYFYNCNFISYGSEATFGEGTQSGGKYWLYNCLIQGIKPYQSHDNINFTVGSQTTLTKCRIIAPTSTDEAIFIHSIGNQALVLSLFQLNKCTVVGLINDTEFVTSLTYIFDNAN